LALLIAITCSTSQKQQHQARNQFPIKLHPVTTLPPPPLVPAENYVARLLNDERRFSISASWLTYNRSKRRTAKKAAIYAAASAYISRSVTRVSPPTSRCARSSYSARMSSNPEASRRMTAPGATTRSNRDKEKKEREKEKKRQMKERMEEEMKSAQIMEEQRLKRCQTKKERDDQRKREEAERKRLEDEVLREPAAPVSTAVSPEGDATSRPDPMETTAILSQLNQGQVEAESNEDDKAASKEAEGNLRSPTKKKQNTGARSSKAAAIQPSRIKLADSIDQYAHTYPRVVVEAGICLTQDDPFQEFIGTLQHLLKNGQLVDPKFAFCPVHQDSKDKKIFDHSGIPINMTMLGAHIRITRNGRNPFTKQKQWGKPAGKGKEEVKDPVVYFTMAIATDIEPSEVISRISHEWSRLGGTRLQVKELQSFDSETIPALFNILTVNSKDTLKSELHQILAETQDRVQAVDCMEFLWPSGALVGDDPIPPFELRLQVPKLPGQDVSHFNKLPWMAQQNRKVFHLECDRQVCTDMKRLIQFAKEFKLVRKMWGRHAHISETVEKTSPQSDIKRLVKVAMRHTNYQCSMTLESIAGITDLDGAAPMYDEEDGEMILGVYSLRTVLLEYFKLESGHHLIAEIHQEIGVPMAPVVVAIPATAEAETIVGMMNKHFPAYAYYTLRDNGLKDDFLIPLLKNSCDNTLTAGIKDCRWDPEKGILTTKEDESNEKDQTALESASWFRNAFASLDFAEEGTRRQAPPPEQLFNINSTSSVGTIHEKHRVKRRNDSSPPPRRNERKGTDPSGVIDLDSDDSDEDSASSSGDDRSRTQATGGVETRSPTSSEEAGTAEDATMGG